MSKQLEENVLLGIVVVVRIHDLEVEGTFALLALLEVTYLNDEVAESED